MILVNATSCKLGGAKQIVERFVADYDFPEDLIVIGPSSLVLPCNIHSHIFIETKGIMTMLFSVILIGWYVLKYKTQAVFSFSNINLIIPLCQRVTYFHQLKILTSSSLRFKMFRFIIRYFLIGNNRFVFQTKYVQNLFTELFGNCESQVCWPGVHLAPKLLPIVKKNTLTALIPYAYINLPQKNFQFFSRINWSQFIRLDSIWVTVQQKNESNSVFEYIGNQSRLEMNNLYFKADILFISSLEETVCLPIFEFASTGKPVLVLSAPYIEAIANEIKLPRNIIIFKPNEFDEILTKVLTNYSLYCELNEIDILPIQKSQWPLLN
ncbi:hypothetical protein [Colwellia sp. Bg11-12]|uniref:hypothetical protein n=1 Tax=Colwellia sp. Bg11-12 TaxID=2759817 RepID=UPI0015F40AE4|nr:hypothetical protein [Colwellia sp. Bg11-12]MBA6263221.1 hypothetical protein [Colwellia sp. Bg11-12]